MRNATKPMEFWEALTGHVTSKVEGVIGASPRVREPVIAYLRELEVVARHECPSREAVQVIASGRRLLGDLSEVGPNDGPFSRT